MTIPSNSFDAVQAVLNQIQNSLASKNISDREVDNLHSDLVAMQQRLASGDYMQTDYLNRNVHDVYRRTMEFFFYFESYHRLARTWQQVLELLDIHSTQSILDICPGWAPKIEMALVYLGYKNRVHILDQDKSVMRICENFLNFFNPQFKVFCHPKNFFEHEEQRTELVIANHVLDDLLLERYSHFSGQTLSEIYRSEASFVEVTAKIPDWQKTHWPEVVKEIADALSRFVCSGGLLILSQYPSLSDQNLTQTLWPEYCFQIMVQVCNQLLGLGFEDESNVYQQAIDSYADRYFPAASLRVLRLEATRPD